MALVVNLLGGPGSGKTVLGIDLFSKFKKQTNIKTELVSEYAKEITYQENGMALADQMLITSTHHHRLFMLNKKVELIITDSSLLNSSVYMEYSKYPNVSKIANDAATSLYKLYKNINIFVPRINKPYQNFGRQQSELDAKILDDKFKDLYLKSKEDAFLNIDLSENTDKEQDVSYIFNIIKKNIEQ